MAVAACPLSYRLGAAALGRAPVVRASVLYAVGGLYGNVEALSYIRQRAAQESAAPTVVFNGDFNFFNAEPSWWRLVNSTIRRDYVAMAGNCEVEATYFSSSGCGCGYPAYTSRGIVERSDRIVGRLRQAAQSALAEDVASTSELLDWLRALPKALVAEVGQHKQRVGIVHGDVDGLAGWQLGVEAMEPADEELRASLGCDAASGDAYLPTTPRSTIIDWCATADVVGLLSTHTCLPFGQVLRCDAAAGDHARVLQPGALAVFNNGSAGMPNFESTQFGLMTRVSDDLTPPADSLYGAVAGGLRYDAIPVHYDHLAWLERFGALWQPGSDAHESYYRRLLHGPKGFTTLRAARDGVDLLA